MAAQLLTAPPDDGHLWIPPDALPGIKILYTPGRNTRDANGQFTYLRRVKRKIITIEISHTMAGGGTETPQSFANGEMPDDATLAEIATFTDGTVLQSLPLDIVGVGSYRGSLVALTHESAEEAGDPNKVPWNPVHLETKARLTAWLIRNPLFKAGDRKWGLLQIRYGLCRSPFAPTKDEGGLGDHTMWDTKTILNTSASGQNPWSKFDKSCPGWERRGTQNRVQFPTGNITDIPLKAGNFRDYYEAVGRFLEEDPDEIIIDQTGDEMPTHRWAPKGFHNQFEMPGGMPVSPGDIGEARRGGLDTSDPFALLPLNRDFHLNRLKALIHRNGITAADIGAGYFERDDLIELTEAERTAYQSLGIPI